VHSSAYKVGNAPRVPLATQAVVDTGSTLLMLPNQTVRDFYAAVPSAQLIDDEGGWVHDCGAALPDLTLEASSSPAGGGGGAESAGTATLVLRGSLLTRGRSSRAGSPWCFGGVQATGAAGMTIWGDVLLKALFVVFDGSEAPAGPRVGFALQATPPAG
jgi:aspergillopepsin I